MNKILVNKIVNNDKFETITPQASPKKNDTDRSNAHVLDSILEELNSTTLKNNVAEVSATVKFGTKTPEPY